MKFELNNCRIGIILEGKNENIDYVKTAHPPPPPVINRNHLIEKRRVLEDKLGRIAGIVVMAPVKVSQGMYS